MPGSEEPVVLLPGAAMRGLVRAIAQMSAADFGRWAVIGGVAVAARLGQAHRVTADVDTVVEQDRMPAAIAVLPPTPRRTPRLQGSSGTSRAGAARSRKAGHSATSVATTLATSSNFAILTKRLYPFRPGVLLWTIQDLNL